MNSPRLALHRSWLLLASLAGVLLLAGPASSAAEAATTVEMRNFLYHPAVVRISPGKRVLFVNGDRTRHDAFRRGVFDTGLLGKGDSALVRFKQRGTYPYYCTLHPSYMRGKVIVE